MTRPRFNRILLKLSGEALMGTGQFGIDREAVDGLAGEIAAAKGQGHELCLVVGGGNIFRGMAAAAKGFDRASADYMGMLATVMNALALQNALLSQLFVRDNKTPVADVVTVAAKDAGTAIQLTGFVRFQLGEGIEKKETDFAAEVAAAAGTSKAEPVA